MFKGFNLFGKGRKSAQNMNVAMANSMVDMGSFAADANSSWIPSDAPQASAARNHKASAHSAVSAPSTTASFYQDRDILMELQVAADFVASDQNFLRSLETAHSALFKRPNYTPYLYLNRKASPKDINNGHKLLLHICENPDALVRIAENKAYHEDLAYTANFLPQILEARQASLIEEIVDGLYNIRERFYRLKPAEQAFFAHYCRIRLTF